MLFNKSADLFSIKKGQTFLSHCAISPLYSRAAQQSVALLQEQQYRAGSGLIEVYEKWMQELKDQSAKLLQTSPENMAFVRNTSEALSMVANGYPFEPGDEVITFVQEYPANYYPWKLQEKRGVKIKLLSNVPAREEVPGNIIGCWSETELQELITPKTKVIALSHVQFTSGYAADLYRLGEICREHDIDLVVDAAQSLGSMPVFPEDCNIAALAAAGWKWLLGPMGTGLFYTAPAFREKLAITQVGAESMLQEFDFLDLSWAPNPTARRFEYSTSPIALVAGLATCLRDVHVPCGANAIYQELIRLQDIFLAELENPAFKPLLFDPKNRSGILTVYCDQAEEVVEGLRKQNVVVTARGGLLRVAPHFYNTEKDLLQLARLLNTPSWIGSGE